MMLPRTAHRAAQYYGATITQALFERWLTEYPDWSPLLHEMTNGKIVTIGMLTSGGFPLNLRESMELIASEPCAMEE